MPASKAVPQRRPPAAAPGGEHELASQVLRQFRLVFNGVKTHFQQVEKRAGVGGAQVWALSIVRERPGIGVGELARTMDLHQSTASNLVRALIAREMMAADRRPDDRRSVQLRLLPAGARVLRKAPGPFSGVLPEALASMDDATLRRLKRDLATLLSALRVDERAARKPLSDL